MNIYLLYWYFHNFIFYWLDTCIFAWNSTFKTLKQITIAHNLYEHVEEIKMNEEPRLRFQMECYHYKKGQIIPRNMKGRSVKFYYLIRLGIPTTKFNEAFELRNNIEYALLLLVTDMSWFLNKKNLLTSLSIDA